MEAGKAKAGAGPGPGPGKPARAAKPASGGITVAVAMMPVLLPMQEAAMLQPGSAAKSRSAGASAASDATTGAVGRQPRDDVISQSDRVSETSERGDRGESGAPPVAIVGVADRICHIASLVAPVKSSSSSLLGSPRQLHMCSVAV